MNNNQTAHKYVLYARKSTESDDKQAASIDSQLNEMRPIARQRGLNIVDTITEAVSGYKKGRAGFNRLIERIENGEIDGIVCWSLSRLARNGRDAGTIIDNLGNSNIKHIITHKKDYYPSEPPMMLYVEFGINNQYSKDLSEDTLRGLRQKAERGWAPQASLPLGYMHNPVDKLRKYSDEEIISDPERFDLIQSIFKDILYEDLKTSEAIEKVISLGITNRNGSKVSRSALYRILNNPFYHGEFRYPKNGGELHQGKHPKMLTKGEFKELQDKLHNKFPPKCKKHEHKYNTLLKCTKCGCSITADPPRTKFIKSKNDTKQYKYYHCTYKRGNCENKYITEEKLEKAIKNSLKSFFLPPEIISILEEEIEKQQTRSSKDIKRRYNTRLKEVNALENKKNKLLDLLIADSISEKDYRDKQKEIEEKIQNLKEMQEEEKEAKVKNSPPAIPYENYDTLPIKVRKKYLKDVYEEMSYYNGKFNFQPSPLVTIFYNVPPKIKEDFEKVRTKDFTVRKQFIEKQIRENDTWGALLDLFINLKIGFHFNLEHLKLFLKTLGILKY